MFNICVEMMNDGENVYFRWKIFRNAATINSLEEFLDTIHTQLDEIWRLPQNYPQNRMVDLMDIICRSFTSNLSFCFSILTTPNIQQFNF